MSRVGANDVPVIPGQLALDLDASEVRALVVEDGMSPEEAEAAVADALGQAGGKPPEAPTPRPCICSNGPMLLISALAVDRRCARCGREPAR
jgi:hypothetical protein